MLCLLKNILGISYQSHHTKYTLSLLINKSETLQLENKTDFEDNLLTNRKYEAINVHYIEFSFSLEYCLQDEFISIVSIPTYQE